MSVHENNNTGQPRGCRGISLSAKAGRRRQHLEGGTLNDLIITNSGSDSEVMLGGFI